MARQIKTSVIAAVATMWTVDMSIARMVCPAEFTHESKKIEYDAYEGSETIALKGNFAKQSNVVKKDGYDTITVNPMEINESIFSGVANTGKKRIGEDIYGQNKGAMSDAEIRAIEDDIEGFGKLVKRTQRLMKKTIYDILVTGKVVVSGDGEKVDEIDYSLTNKIVNDNATPGQYQWNDGTNANPIEQLETEAENNKYSVDTYVLGREAKKAFLSNPTTLTADNTSTGEIKTFSLSTREQREQRDTKYMKYLGQTEGVYGKPVDIYYELEQYDNNGTDTDYLDKNYAVGFEMGNEMYCQRHYGGIERSVKNGDSSAEMELFVGKELLTAKDMEDPDGVKRRYRTSPLVTMNQPNAFISIKATLIA